MEKLAELHDSRAWILRLKEQSDEIDGRAKTALQNELKRSETPSAIFSGSHSIRAKELAEYAAP
jgi:hypothetical protein